MNFGGSESDPPQDGGSKWTTKSHPPKSYLKIFDDVNAAATAILKLIFFLLLLFITSSTAILNFLDLQWWYHKKCGTIL